VAVTGVVGTTTGAVEAGEIIGDTAIVLADMVVAMDGATTADPRATIYPCGSEPAREDDGTFTIVAS